MVHVTTEVLNKAKFKLTHLSPKFEDIIDYQRLKKIFGDINAAVIACDIIQHNRNYMGYQYMVEKG